MALAGLKKQFNKANQYVSEKMGAAAGTKFTEDFMEMEKKTETTIELVDDLLNKTKEYLQPNPASRAKLMLSSKVATARAHAYVQPEGALGESMIKHGRRLGDDNTFGESLSEMGEALKQMSEIKYALEDTVKQNFLEPLTHLQNKDIRDVQHHRRKLESRRLDFDCKRRHKKGAIPSSTEELKIAEDKFEESFNLASMGMFNLLQNEAEQISQLNALSEALFEYHSQCASIMESLTSRLNEFRENAAQKPAEQYEPKKLSELEMANSGPTVRNSDELVPGNGADSGNGQFNGGGNKLFSYSFSQPSQSSTSDGTYKPRPMSPARSPATSPTKPSSLFLATNSGANTEVTSPMASPLPSPVRSPARTPVARGPSCQALYDFDAENAKELPFKEGDIIQLVTKLDDNWFEGKLSSGRTGIFPVSYVQVLVPIGQQ